MATAMRPAVMAEDTCSLRVRAGVFARDVRQQNAETLVAAPIHGAKRLAACCTQLLETLDLRGFLLHASGPNVRLPWRPTPRP